MTELLFVYGSLLEESQHEMALFLKRYVKVIGRGFVRGRLYLVDWYPGAVYDPQSEYKIWGSLVEVSQPKMVLPKLDEYEGSYYYEPEKSLFLRKEVKVSLKNAMHKAWFYTYNNPTDNCTFIETGDYIAFIREKRT